MQHRHSDEWEHIGEKLRQIVQRVHSLHVCHRDPHRFHEDKSEIAHELAEIASRL